MSQLTTIPTTILPASMSPALERRVSMALNKIDPAGVGYSISADDALDNDDRQALVRRHGRLAACLAPAGEQAALVALGEMQLMMLGTGLSQQESDKALDLWCKHLGDLPAFAISAAAVDFMRGDVGERGFVPKLPVFRQHAVGKLAPYADDKARIGKLIAAHKDIRPSRAKECPDRRAEVVRLARESWKGMALAGKLAEEDRAGRIIDRKPPESPQEALARLEAERDKPIAPLSEAARAPFHIPDIREEEAHG